MREGTSSVCLENKTPDQVAGLMTGSGGNYVQTAQKVTNLVAEAKDPAMKKEIADTQVKKVKASIDDTSKAVINQWQDRMQYLKRTQGQDVGMLFVPGKQEVSAGWNQFLGDTGNFVGKAWTSLKKLDFKQLGQDVTDYGSNFTQAAGIILKGIGGLTGSMLSFAIYSITAMSPVLLIMGGLVLVAIALFTNFLGLRSIIGGLANVIWGFYKAAVAVQKNIGTVIDGIKKIFLGLGAALRGDFSQVQDGWDTLMGGLKSMSDGVMAGLDISLGGLLSILRGLGEAATQVATGPFVLIKDAIVLVYNVAKDLMGGVKTLGEWLITCATSPAEAWNQLLETITNVLQKVGKAVRSVTEAPQKIVQKITGKKSDAPSPEAAPGETGPIPIVKKKKSWFKNILGQKSEAEIINKQTYHQAVASDAANSQMMSAAAAGLPISIPAPVVGQVTEAHNVGAATVSPVSVPMPVVGKVTEAQNVGAAAAASVPVIIPAPVVGQVTEAHHTDAGNVPTVVDGAKPKPEKDGAAAIGKTSDALNSLGMALSGISPQVGLPILGFTSLLSSINSIGETLPEMGSLMQGVTPILQGIGTTAMAAAGMQVTSEASKGAAAEVAAAVQVQAGVAGSTAAVIEAAVVTESNAVMGSSFLGVGAAAETGWAMISGPLLPIIIGLAAIGAVVASVWVAFQTGFFGIGDAIQGVWEVISSLFGWLTGGFALAFQRIWDQVTQPFTMMSFMLYDLAQQIRIMLQPLQGIVSFALQLAFALTPVGIAILTIRGAIEIFGYLLQGIGAILGAVFGEIGAQLSMTWRMIIEPFQPLINWFKQLNAQMGYTSTSGSVMSGVFSLMARVILLPFQILGQVLISVIKVVGAAVRALVWLGYSLIGLLKFAKPLIAPFAGIAGILVKVGSVVGGLVVAIVSMHWALSGIGPMALRSFGMLQGAIMSSGGVVSGLFSKIINLVGGGDLLAKVNGFVANSYNWIVSGVKRAWTAMVGYAAQLWTSITSGTLLASINSSLSASFLWLKTTIGNLWTSLVGYAAKLWTAITSGTLLTWVNGVLSSSFLWLKTTIGGLWTSLVGYATKLWTAITSGTLLSTVNGALSSTFLWLETTMGSLWTSLVGYATQLWEGITSGTLLAAVNGALSSTFMWLEATMVASVDLIYGILGRYMGGDYFRNPPCYC